MSQETKSSEHYNGIEELELLDDANNYIGSIISNIRNFFEFEKLTLDFGAGAGSYAKAMREQGFQVECLEIDPNLIGMLNNLKFTVHTKLEELEEGKIHQIYSINVLEHIEDDQMILNTFYKLLNKGGKVYLYLPAFPILYSNFDKKIGHFRRYKREDLLEKVKRAGFEVKNISYRDSIGFFVALIFKLISNADSVSKSSITIYDKLIFPFSKLLDPILGKFFGKNIEIELYKNS